MDIAIEVKGLTKSYGDVKAVNGISFEVPAGSLFAFLGVNGAGKSTTINMLGTLLKPDCGEASICGVNIVKQPDKVRSLIGIVFQNSVLDNRLSVRENLVSRASFYGIFGEDCKRRMARLGELLELDEIFSRPYGKLSGGQRRRVDVARGIIHSPKILFLDEPTTGLDPMTRKSVWNVVEELRKESGMTVFLTTHYMEEAANANRVVIMDEGSIVANGTPVELKNAYSGDYLKLYAPRSGELDAALDGVKHCYEGGFYRISVKDSEEAADFILSHRDIVKDFEVVKGDMDDVFLNVTGKRLMGGEYEK